MCSYCRARLLPFFTPAGGIEAPPCRERSRCTRPDSGQTRFARDALRVQDRRHADDCSDPAGDARERRSARRAPAPSGCAMSATIVRASPATATGARSTYRGLNGATIRDAEETDAHRRARDPAGLDGRVDLPLARRARAGDRARRQGPEAIPVPPDWRAARERQKFAALATFGVALPAIRRRRRATSHMAT